MKLCILCNPERAYEVFAIKSDGICDYADKSSFGYGDLIKGLRNFIIENNYDVDKIFVRGAKVLTKKIVKDIQKNFPNIEVE